MGPAPAVAEVRLAVRQALVGLADTPIFVACSGGADSLALASAVAFERDTAGRRAESGKPPVTGLVTVDHQLQAGSAEQAQQVARLGYELGFDPVVALAVEVEQADGPEADARTARYAALSAIASTYGAIITLGHTLDDQAETVLLGLGRGSGPRSVCGMSPRQGQYLRPFLGVRRASTTAACAALGLPVWHDPHNEDERYTRVGLRRIMTDLERVLHGGVAEALARTAELTRQDLEALDLLAAERYRALGDEREPLVSALASEPAALRQRIVRLWVAEVMGHGLVPALTSAHYEAIDALVTRWHGQGPVDLPHGFVLWRASGRLRLAPRTAIR